MLIAAVVIMFLVFRSEDLEEICKCWVTWGEKEKEKTEYEEHANQLNLTTRFSVSI